MRVAFAASLGLAVAFFFIQLVLEPPFSRVTPRVPFSSRPPRRLAVVIGRWGLGSLEPALGTLGVDPRRFAVAQVAGVAAAIVLAVILRRAWAAPFLAAAAWTAAGWAVKWRLAIWRRAVLAELGEAVKFLDLELAAGAVVPAALGGAAALLGGPLGSEFRRVGARAAELHDGPAALDEFARRVADPDCTAVARRLGAAWRVHAPGPETFAGLGETVRRLQEARIVARTRLLPTVYVLLVGWLLLATLGLVVPPVVAGFTQMLAGV